MATFAVIKDGVVDNVIVAISQTVAEEVTGLTCIEHPAPRIGAACVDGVIEEPVLAEPNPLATSEE